jgi:hypothetical protein
MKDIFYYLFAVVLASSIVLVYYFFVKGDDSYIHIHENGEVHDHSLDYD